MYSRYIGCVPSRQRKRDKGKEKKKHLISVFPIWLKGKKIINTVVGGPEMSAVWSG